MPRKRPGVVTAAAVLCIIYGSLGLVCGVCGLAGQAIQDLGNPGGGQQGLDQKELEAALEREIPFYKTFNLASGIWTMIESAALLVAGIGLLSLQTWSRMFAIIFILLAIMHMIALAGFQLLTLPVLSRLMEAQPQVVGPAGKGAEMVQTLMIVIGVFMGIFYVAVIVYLLVALFLLMKPAAKAALAGHWVPEDHEAERRFDEDRAQDRYADDEGWPPEPPRGPPDDRLRG